MNAHDSEKVVGTLVHSGYTQVRPPKRPAWWYTTPAASGTKPSRRFSPARPVQAGDRKGKGVRRDRLRRAAGGREHLREAPHVSLVAGSASYTKLPEMLVQLEAGNRRVTGLNLDTDETFDTPFTRRDNPHRAYITIIEGCNKSVRLLRGSVHPRPGAQPDERKRDARSAGPGGRRILRNPASGTDREQLQGSVAGRLGFCHAARPRGRIPGIRRVRFTTSHPRNFVKEIVDAIDENPALCNHVHLPVQSGSSRVLERCSGSTPGMSTCGASNG